MDTAMTKIIIASIETLLFLGSFKHYITKKNL